MVCVHAILGTSMNMAMHVHRVDLFAQYVHQQLHAILALISLIPT